MMAGIRSRHTRPERVVRRGLHSLGFRFGLHNRRLKGTPDLVLPKYGADIFVHGCFWHGHTCSLFRMPSTRTAFWKAKIERNRTNDGNARGFLLKDGWRVLTIWECALRGHSDVQISALLARVSQWLKSSRKSLELRDTQRNVA